MKPDYHITAVKKLRMVFLVILILNCFAGKGQNFFRGGLIGGLNMSQVDGDQLAGYDKLGLTAGAKVEFPLSRSMDAALEFLFSQRGSRSRLIPGSFSDIQIIHLNYIEVPAVIQWSDWWEAEEEYYRVHLQSGLSYGRLINSRTNLSSSAISGAFNVNDLSYFIGGSFSFTSHFTLAVRYTRSILPLYTFTNSSFQRVDALLGYFVTIRSEYFF